MLPQRKNALLSLTVFLLSILFMMYQSVTALGFEHSRTAWSIVDDFLVNDDSIGVWDQYSPAIAKDPSGKFIIVWADSRKSYYDYGIYAQRFDSAGLALGPNFKVNDAHGPAWQWGNPSVAIDGSGNFVITWEDNRSGNWDIYAQRYDSSEAALGANFKLNDDTTASDQKVPVVATCNAGDFIIVWEDGRDGNPDVYAQRYNNAGAPVGSNFKVSDDTFVTWQYSPAIGATGYGDFIIVWEDFRNGNYDIYYQRYDSLGFPSGSNHKVNDDSGATWQTYPAISINGHGDCVVTWQDQRNGNSDIYAQRYDSSGNKLGINFRVNADVGTADQDNSDLDLDDLGNLIVTWTDKSKRSGCQTYPEIFAQRYNPDGSSLGSNFKVNDDTGDANHSNSSTIVSTSGDFIITWQDTRNHNFDIYAQRYSPSGTPLGTNFMVNDDRAEQLSPDISKSGGSNFVIVWYENRNDKYYYDIYAQRYNPSGIALGSNFKVNDTDGIFWSPALSLDGNDNFVITWTDGRNLDYDVYAQRYDSSGTPKGSNFRVNDDTGKSGQSYPAIASDVFGNFVVTWIDERKGVSEDIYGQRFNPTGYPLGPNFRVNDDTVVADHQRSDVAMQDDGDFIIVWYDNRNGRYNSDIYAQRFDSSGNRLGSNFKVNDDTGASYQINPKIAAALLGDFVITWQDYRNGKLEIYAQRYNLSGTPLGDNFRVNDGIAGVWSPDLAMDDNGNFIIVWTDERNGWPPDIYAQRYDSTGVPEKNNFLVPNPQYASYYQQLPAVAADNSSIYFTWQDDRKGNWDIYAKIVDWDWTDVKDEQIVGLPKSFELGQNYPNPFNPTTTILFKAGGSQFRGQSLISTTLKIYNILGQKVRTLVDENKSPGNYKIIWDGKDDSGKEVASGIYFYQLKTEDYTATKKMVLLR
jgi:hypothetical protein